MEKEYLVGMFPALNRAIVELALDASGGSVDPALNALLKYVTKLEGGGGGDGCRIGCDNEFWQG